MVRSWDERVKGATEKAVAPADLSPVERKAPPEKAYTQSSGWVTSFTAHPVDRHVEPVAGGLALAVSAARIPVVVVDRSSSVVLWASEAWLARFGARHTFNRYSPTSTDFGEAPLPPPGENWQRTRTMILNDGSEDLVEMVLLGGEVDSDQIVTIMARDRLSATPLVSDRSEVIGVIDSLVSDAADRSVAVLYVDIDRFKVVHDLVGNLEARRLLDVVGRRVAATVREGDLLFQMPGDEFVILASNLEAPFEAEELAERLRSTVATMSDVGHEMALTASVGVAFVSADTSGDALLSDAETAVYVAKGRGRNRVAIHDDEVRSRSDRILKVERQLRRAIERKQVEVAYQPMIDTVTGAVVGAEALLRLGGEVGLSTVEVVAAAEQSGLMGDLGSLVTGGVRDQFGDWLTSEEDRILMVNLSANQMADQRLLGALTAIADDPAIRSGRFAIEVSEAVARENRAAFEELSARVRPRVLIGIDGFGNRFTSLADLGELTVDYVKLHRSVTNLFGRSDHGHGRAANIVRSVASAGVTVVALGVERHDQIEGLQVAGCRLAQGFLYAGALSAEELRTFRVDASTIGRVEASTIEESAQPIR